MTELGSSHAGLALLRRLTDKAGLTRGLSQALCSGRVLGHDRGRILADISCAIADGARAISDFRVLTDRAEAFGQAASVPAAYWTLLEITWGRHPDGEEADRRDQRRAAARGRRSWRGKLPGVWAADKMPEDVTCIRLDARHPCTLGERSGRRDFKGFGHHPLLSFCDNADGEPLAWMLRKGSAGGPITSAWWTRRSRRCRRCGGGT